MHTFSLLLVRNNNCAVLQLLLLVLLQALFSAAVRGALHAIAKAGMRWMGVSGSQNTEHRAAC